MNNIQAEIVKIFSGHKYPIEIDENLKLRIFDSLSKEICINLNECLKRADEEFSVAIEEVLKSAFGFQEWRCTPVKAQIIYTTDARKLLHQELIDRKIPFKLVENYHNHFFFRVEELYCNSKAKTRKILV